jgi:hypothetical protein
MVICVHSKECVQRKEEKVSALTKSMPKADLRLSYDRPRIGIIVWPQKPWCLVILAGSSSI